MTGGLASSLLLFDVQSSMVVNSLNAIAPKFYEGDCPFPTY